MELIQTDFKKGKVLLKITGPEDAWHLSHLVEPGDLLTGKTTRKIKVGSESNPSLVKKTFTLTIQAESVECQEAALRVNGKVIEGPEDVPHGSYHTITLEEGSEYSLEKEHWLNYQRQKLHEASEQTPEYLLCILDREEALLAVSKAHGYHLIARLQGEVIKKNQPTVIKTDFYGEIVKMLTLCAEQYAPAVIIVASPAFYKEELLKRITSQELKKKIVLATCSNVSEAAFNEIIRQPELEQALKASRIRKETLVVEELLKEIKHLNKAAYGWKEVQLAVKAGAVQKLILTYHFLHNKRISESYEELDSLMKQADEQQGEIYLLSSEEEPGRKVDGLGGIAAILRYKIAWKDG